MTKTNQSTSKFYLVILIHPQHGIRTVEFFAKSLKSAEEIASNQWNSTQWKVDHRA